MSEPDFSDYVESLGASLTVVVLIVGFIFTALTLVLLEMQDLTSILAQATLLVLMVAFVSSMLGLAILLTRIQVLSELELKAEPPTTPGWSGPSFFNLLTLSSILLMSISIVLTMSFRGLTYLSLVSATIVVLAFVFYLLCISPYRLKRYQGN